MLQARPTRPREGLELLRTVGHGGLRHGGRRKVAGHGLLRAGVADAQPAQAGREDKLRRGHAREHRALHDIGHRSCSLALQLLDGGLHLGPWRNTR